VTTIDPEIESIPIDINMGPQHPSTHGVLRVLLKLDGETVVSAEPEIGFLHTGIEKQTEQLFWQQAVTVVDRADYLAPLSNSLCYVLAVERLLGPRLDGGVLVVPPAAAEKPLSRLTVVPGEHPVPGPASVAGARALLEQAGRLGERDLAICVFTGGSSALASLPPPGITNTDKARLHRLLLRHRPRRPAGGSSHRRSPAAARCE